MNLTLLVGPSGSGKSTLLSSLRATGRASHFGRTYHVPNFDVQNTILIKSEPLVLRGTLLDNITCFGHFEKQKALACIQSLHLEHLAERYLSYRDGIISRGEAQRIVLARIICSKVGAILMDESLNGLGDLLESECMEAIRKLASNKVFIIVSHSRLDANLFDEVWMLNDS